MYIDPLDYYEQHPEMLKKVPRHLSPLENTLITIVGLIPVAVIVALDIWMLWFAK
jgi:hypothetical protein